MVLILELLRICYAGSRVKLKGVFRCRLKDGLF